MRARAGKTLPRVPLDYVHPECISTEPVVEIPGPEAGATPEFEDPVSTQSDGGMHGFEAASRIRRQRGAVLLRGIGDEGLGGIFRVQGLEELDIERHAWSGSSQNGAHDPSRMLNVRWNLETTGDRAGSGLYLEADGRRFG